ALLEPHGHHGGDLDHPELLEQFMALALLSAPALLAGYVLAGLISGFMGASPARWLGRGNRLTQASKGVALGLPLPVCSCGVLPVYESLVKRGAAPAAGLAFLIATPELGVDALAISLPLLGTELTVVRLVGALLVALSVALLLGGAVGPKVEPSPQPEAQKTAVGSRLAGGMRFGLIELFDHTMPWVLLGLLLAALVAPLLDQALLTTIPAAVQVPLLTFLAIPAYVCASGATPIAAVALQAGLSPGAAMAFLLAGPATNVTTFGILSRLHGRAFALKFGCAMAMAAMLVGWAMNLMTFNVPELGLDHDHAEGTPLQLVSLGLLGLLALASLLRQGPRGMLTQVLAPFRS
ncbi:MAG: permease, partial [Pseudomonadota bacterium]